MITIDKTRVLPASYKDPSGFLFIKDNVLYRQVNDIYQTSYDQFMTSGLYKKLIEKGWLVKHKEVALSNAHSPEAYKVIKPDQIEFVSYPYEWCFDQLKDAALLTLEICRCALKYNMILKDTSAYNIAFSRGKAVFIDTLSFEEYQEGRPWIAYKQFCEHFLGPLVLTCYKGPYFFPFFRTFLDGFPVGFVSNLLPKLSLINPGILMHISLHARTQKITSNKKITSVKKNNLSKQALVGILKSLYQTVKSLNLSSYDTEWGNYYKKTNYSSESFLKKRDIVVEFTKLTKPDVLLDLGANMGEFSRAVIPFAKLILSTDYDHTAVNKNYNEMKRHQETKLIPLVLDITNPSPSLGFGGDEHDDFFSRKKIDTILALALIHHLSISRNLPFQKIAAYFSTLAKYLIIEFVEKEDSQVQLLLQNRQDIFNNYSQKDFEKIFSSYYIIQNSERISGTKRTLYLMQSKHFSKDL